MRRLPALFLVVATVCAGCASGPDPSPRPTPAKAASVSLESLNLDWPKAQGMFNPPERPDAPEGFDDALLDRMATVIRKWAGLAAVDDAVWHSAKPIDDISAALPEAAATTLAKQVKEEVSPRLGVANVFDDALTIVGTPRITSAWRVSTAKDDAGKRYVLLELQTRAAYEVRRPNGPARVIGVLRVHGLSAYADTREDYGVSGGWQEFGAGDCALALDDDLLPDSDAADAKKDLKTFIRVGNGTNLEMPNLGVQDLVDEEYLKRCREGQV